MPAPNETTGLTYPEAMERLWRGERITLPGWNDESWMAKHDGRLTVFRGGQPTDCQPRNIELLRKDWRVVS